jgi:hypothetical protein
MNDLPDKAPTDTPSQGRFVDDVDRMRDRASRWRLRALEMRAMADDYMTEEARDAMNGAADQWDQMAAAAEAKAVQKRP